MWNDFSYGEQSFILQLEREFQDKTFGESFLGPEKLSWTTGAH